MKEILRAATRGCIPPIFRGYWPLPSREEKEVDALDYLGIALVGVLAVGVWLCASLPPKD